MTSRIKIKKLLKTLSASLCIALLSSCGTVSPNVAKDRAPSHDETTPASMNPNTSGFLGYVTNERKETIGALITKGRVDLYNALIGDYRLQYKESTGFSVSTGDGIESRGLKDGKEVFFIDSRHLAIFFKLNRWKKEGRAADSLWMRVKDKVTP